MSEPWTQRGEDPREAPPGSKAPGEWTEERVRQAEELIVLLTEARLQLHAAEVMYALLARVKELEGENKYLRHTLRLEADTDSAYSDLGTE